MSIIENEKVYLQVFGKDTDAERTMLIDEMGQEIQNPFITIRLNRVQIQSLSGYMKLLPSDVFRLFGLYYCFNYSDMKLTRTTGVINIRGTLNYYKDRLTQCMDLPRPIAELYWKMACDKCLMDRCGL